MGPPCTLDSVYGVCVDKSTCDLQGTAYVHKDASGCSAFHANIKCCAKEKQPASTTTACVAGGVEGVCANKDDCDLVANGELAAGGCDGLPAVTTVVNRFKQRFSLLSAECAMLCGEK